MTSWRSVGVPGQSALLLPGSLSRSSIQRPYWFPSQTPQWLSGEQPSYPATDWSEATPPLSSEHSTLWKAWSPVPGSVSNFSFRGPLQHFIRSFSSWRFTGSPCPPLHAVQTGSSGCCIHRLHCREQTEQFHTELHDAVSPALTFLSCSCWESPLFSTLDWCLAINSKSSWAFCGSKTSSEISLSLVSEDFMNWFWSQTVSFCFSSFYLAMNILRVATLFSELPERGRQFRLEQHLISSFIF